VAVVLFRPVSAVWVSGVCPQWLTEWGSLTCRHRRFRGCGREKCPPITAVHMWLPEGGG